MKKFFCELDDMMKKGYLTFLILMLFIVTYFLGCTGGLIIANYVYDHPHSYQEQQSQDKEGE